MKTDQNNRPACGLCRTLTVSGPASGAKLEAPPVPPVVVVPDPPADSIGETVENSPTFGEPSTPEAAGAEIAAEVDALPDETIAEAARLASEPEDEIADTGDLD